MLRRRRDSPARACLRLRRSGRQAVPAHDFHHLRFVRRASVGGVDSPNASRKYSGPIAAGVITQSALASSVPLLSNRCTAPRGMHSACPRANIDLFSIDRPGRHTFDAVDRFFVVVVTMRRRRQPLRSGDQNLKRRNASVRLVSGKQETYSEPLGADRFIGRIKTLRATAGCGIAAFPSGRLY